MLNLSRTASVIVRSNHQLSCVWIETGNPRRPLARVWIDSKMRAFREAQDSSSVELDAPGDDPAQTKQHHGRPYSFNENATFACFG